MVGSSYVAIGRDVVILEHSSLLVDPGNATSGPILHIGDGSRLGRSCTIWCGDGVQIGSRVGVSDGVAIIDCWRTPGGPKTDEPMPEAGQVSVEDGAYLGAESVIGPGVRIGKGAFVGEGAVVVDDVPAHTVVYGNPAKIVRSWAASHGWRDAAANSGNQ